MSDNLNLCMFTGRLARDPEFKEFEKARVAQITLCTSRSYKSKHLNQKVVDKVFIDMEAWDTGGDIIVNNLRKGDFIAVQCSVKQHRWTTQEGKKRSKICFRIDKFDYVRPRRQVPKQQTTEPAAA